MDVAYLKRASLLLASLILYSPSYATDDDATGVGRRNFSSRGLAFLGKEIKEEKSSGDAFIKKYMDMEEALSNGPGITPDMVALMGSVPGQTFIEKMVYVKNKINPASSNIHDALVTTNVALQNPQNFIEGVNNLNQTLTQRNAQIAVLTQTIDQKDTQIAGLNTTVTQQATEIQQKDIQITGLNTTVTQQATEIQQKDIQITGLNTTVTQQAAEIQQKDTQIAGLNTTVTQQATEIQQKDTQITLLNQQLAQIITLANDLRGKGRSFGGIYPDPGEITTVEDALNYFTRSNLNS